MMHGQQNVKLSMDVRLIHMRKLMAILRDWLKNLKRKDHLGDVCDNIKMVLRAKQFFF